MIFNHNSLNMHNTVDISATTLRSLQFILNVCLGRNCISDCVYIIIGPSFDSIIYENCDSFFDKMKCKA